MSWISQNKILPGVYANFTASGLHAFTPGQRGRVAELTAAGIQRRRMLDLGLVEGTQVEAVHKSPAGDPVAYLVRGALIALRDEDAGRVLLVPEP